MKIKSVWVKHVTLQVKWSLKVDVETGEVIKDDAPNEYTLDV